MPGCAAATPGQGQDKGTWRINGDRIILALLNQGRQLTAADEAACGAVLLIRR